MKRHYEVRTNEGYEVQLYDAYGNYKSVTGCDTLAEVAEVLISICNGSLKGNYPTVWKDGKLM